MLMDSTHTKATTIACVCTLFEKSRINETETYDYCSFVSSILFSVSNLPTQPYNPLSTFDSKTTYFLYRYISSGFPGNTMRETQKEKKGNKSLYSAA